MCAYFLLFFIISSLWPGFPHLSASKSSHHNCNNEPGSTKAKRKHRYHLNTLWSIWYGVLFTYFQGYLILNGAYRFLGKQQQRHISMHLHVWQLIAFENNKALLLPKVRVFESQME